MKTTGTKHTVIEESAITRVESVPAQIPATWQLPAEPSWDRARALVNDVRRSVCAIIELGAEITALRDQFFAFGARTDINGRQSITANVTQGWQQKVQDEHANIHMTA